MAGAASVAMRVVEWFRTPLAQDMLIMLLDNDVGTVFAKVAGRPSEWPRRIREVYVEHLLRRAAVPLVPLLICCVSILIGELIPTMYDWTVVPSWHLLANLLSFYPYCVLYPRATAEWRSPVLLTICGIFAFGSAFAEVTMAQSNKHLGFAVGNTLCGLFGVLVIPASVYWRGVKLKDAGPASPIHTDRIVSPRPGGNGAAVGVGPGHVDAKVAIKSGSRWGAVRGESGRVRIDALSQFRNAFLLSGADALPLHLSAGTAVFAALVTWFAYLAPASDDRAFLWRLMVLTLPPQIVLVGRDWNKQISYSFPYAVFFGVVAMRLPDSYGHLTLDMFRVIESMAGDQKAEWVGAVKFALSIGYAAGMQLCFMLLSRVTAFMTESNVYPRFLFPAQIFYYLFWYLLLGSENVYSWVFWAMLLLMNANYIFGSTGLYLDLLRGALPFSCTAAYLGNFAPRVTLRRPQGATGELPAMIGIDSSMARHRSSVFLNSRGREARTLGAVASVGAQGDTTPRDLALQDLDWQEREAVRQFLFRVKLAEQDTLADLACLICVPSIITCVAIFGRDDGDGVGLAKGLSTARMSLPQLWMRFLCMAVLRTFSARVSRAVFSRKFKTDDSSDGAPATTVVAANTDAEAPLLSIIGEGLDEEAEIEPIGAAEPTKKLPGRRRQSFALHEPDPQPAAVEPTVNPSGPSQFYSATMSDLKDCFWYYVIVIVLAVFSCLQMSDSAPARYAFLNAHL